MSTKVGDGFPDKVAAFHKQMAVHGTFDKTCPTCGPPASASATQRTNNAPPSRSEARCWPTMASPACWGKIGRGRAKSWRNFENHTAKTPRHEGTPGRWSLSRFRNGGCLAGEIVDAAYHVHRALGPGLLESIYETWICHELVRRSLGCRRQVAVPITYPTLTLDEGLHLDVLVVIELKPSQRCILFTRRGFFLISRWWTSGLDS